jgi:riboflavin biosynthesis pyrimidine reductase
MKPHIICHMGASVDGRTLLSRWHPQDVQAVEGVYNRLHAQLKGDAWLVGRTTGEEFSKATQPYPQQTGQIFPREAWIVRRDAPSYGIVVDAHGKIAWGCSDIGGDPIVVALTEQVPDSHLAGLRADGVSYVFAGRQEIDLAALLATLNRELGIKRLLLEGGGIINGAFLRAGLVDELSLIINPAVDGAKGAPAVFDSHAAGEQPAPVESMTLDSCQVLEGGVVWLRYQLRNRP